MNNVNQSQNVIHFSVPAIPVAQPRQRQRWTGKHVQNYTPVNSPVNAFKASVRLALKQAYDCQPLEGPLYMYVVFYMPRPKNMIWKTKPMPLYSHAKKPDLDNLIKALTDAMTGLAWRDDSQVAKLNAEKVVCGKNSQPGVSVSVGRWIKLVWDA